MSSTLQGTRVNAKAQVDLVDDHDEVIEKWRSHGVQNQTLLHFDEHADFQWLSNVTPAELLNAPSLDELASRLDRKRGWITGTPVNRTMHLGNYLDEAFRSGMVSQWYWVIPDPLWNSKRLRKWVGRELEMLYRDQVGPMEKPTRESYGFKTRIYSADTFVGPLQNLPRFEQPALLNFDVDFLTAEDELRPRSAAHYRRRLPWIWPEELLALLKQKNICASLAAVANSVNGGYTPIQYKFLGEVLRSLLDAGSLPEGYETLKQSILLRHENRQEKALALLQSFQAAGSIETARLYQIAQISYEQSCLHEARQSFQCAVELDPEFKSRFNSQSSAFEKRQMAAEALEEHQMIQSFAPDLAEPLAGEARNLKNMGRFKGALKAYRKALAIDSDHKESLFQSAALSLLHMKARSVDILPSLEKLLRLDPRYPFAHTLYALCLIREKRFEPAKQHLREALKYGEHTPLTYRLLGHTYRGLRLRKKAFEMYRESLRLMLLSWVSHLKRKVQPWTI